MPSRFSAVHHQLEDLLSRLTKSMSAEFKNVYDNALNAIYRARHSKFLASLDIFDDWSAKIAEHLNLMDERLAADKARRAKIDMEIDQQINNEV